MIANLLPRAFRALLALLLVCFVNSQEVSFGNLFERQHNVKGQVVALSERVIEIRNFRYDGQGPAVRFWLDTNPVPSTNGMGLMSPYNENCGVHVVRAANGTETVRAELPEGDSLVNYTGGSFSLWCESFAANFGEVVIPSVLEGLPGPNKVLLACFTNASAQEIVIGNLTEREHNVNGKVVALSERVLEIRNFRFDGQGPAVHFWLDTNPVPSDNGVGLASPYNENCGLRVNRAANGTVTVRIELAEGDSLVNYAGGSFSLWCEQFSANFGEVVIPTTLVGLAGASDVPLQCAAAPIVIGNLTEREHNVNGEVVALSERALEIRNFQFDGQGPAVHFWLDTNPVPSDNGVGLASPYNENCGLRVNRAANGTVTVRIELAEGDSLVNYAGGSFSLWCEQFSANFGEVVIPTTLVGLAGASDVPLQCSTTPTSQATPRIAMTPDGFNCEQLTDNFQVRWQVDGENLHVELVGLDIGDGTYLAFGLSGSDNKTLMFGADAVIADIDSAGTYRARDIYMGQYAQCSNGVGVCPDGEFGTFTEDVTNVTGESSFGLTVFRYTRPITPTDIEAMDANGAAVDRVIPLEGDTFIVWAIGPISPSNGFPNFHSVFPGSKGEDKNYSLNFGRDVVDNCKPMVSGIGGAMDDDTGDDEALAEPFTRPVLNVNGDTTEFVAHIGPSGGPRGYLAITGGRVAWGISWYINGLILPEIVLRRGTTYRFLVNGGDDKTQTSLYHPFYITDSIAGGYSGLSPAERLKENVVAGIVVIAETAAGVTDYAAPVVAPICVYKATDDTMAAFESLADYDAYFATLDDSCARNTSITSAAAVLEFTPNESTPDLLYYQCVTHQNLGWKIRVVDADGSSSSVMSSFHSCFINFLVATALFVVFM